MEPSREFSRTPPRLPPSSDVSVFQKTRMLDFWDTHHIYWKYWLRHQIFAAAGTLLDMASVSFVRVGPRYGPRQVHCVTRVTRRTRTSLDGSTLMVSRVVHQTTALAPSTG